MRKVIAFAGIAVVVISCIVFGSLLANHNAEEMARWGVIGGIAALSVFCSRRRRNSAETQTQKINENQLELLMSDISAFMKTDQLCIICERDNPNPDDEFYGTAIETRMAIEEAVKRANQQGLAIYKQMLAVLKTNRMISEEARSPERRAEMYSAENEKLNDLSTEEFVDKVNSDTMRYVSSLEELNAGIIECMNELTARKQQFRKNVIGGMLELGRQQLPLFEHNDQLILLRSALDEKYMVMKSVIYFRVLDAIANGVEVSGKTHNRMKFHCALLAIIEKEAPSRLSGVLNTVTSAANYVKGFPLVHDPDSKLFGYCKKADQEYQAIVTEMPLRSN